MKQSVRFVDANGLRHCVAVTGDARAPAVILMHGFPDSKEVWDAVTLRLASAGFRVIAPDMRGFGDTDAPPAVDDYDILAGAAPDIIGVMDALEIKTAHLVGHDFGAAVGWALAANYAARFRSYAALSVGHPRAFLSAGWEQRQKSFYILCHQCRGLAEFAYRANSWALFRRHWRGGDVDRAIALLSRRSRLTAGLNWYRANAPLKRILGFEQDADFGEEIVRIPTLGVWSDKDPYLGETQIKNSSEYVDARWHYECIPNAGHWLQTEAPEALAQLLVGHWRSIT